MNINDSNHHSEKSSLSNVVRKHTSVNTAQCYQCGKCSAGCPLAEDMDITSSTVMRMLQIEDETTDNELLQSQTIWLCASCEMCISRCPMQIDIPKIMDCLRQQSLKDGLQHKSAKREIVSFHQSFLEMIRLTGRSYEVGLIANYKLRSKKFFQDLTLVPELLRRGKLPIFPETIKEKKEIDQIFKKSKPL